MATTDLTAASVRKAVRNLQECIPRVPPGIVEVIGREAGHSVGTPERRLQDEFLASAECALSPVPWFWHRDDKLDSPQLQFFGFYVLRSAIRGAMLAANFYASGRLLLAREHYGPAVALFYTALFHLCQAYLALHGKVTVSPVLTEPFVLIERELKMIGHAEWPQPQMVLCTLTSCSRWIIEGRSRSHGTIWREVGSVLMSDEDGKVPHWLSAFLEHIRQDSPEELADADIPELLSRLAAFRHKALYEGIGIPESSMAPSGPGQVIFATALSSRASHFEKLTSKWLEHVLDYAVPLLVDCQPDGTLRRALITGIASPAMDPPALEWLEGCDSYELFERLTHWILAEPRDQWRQEVNSVDSR
jgi:hypothetical protein